MNWPALFETLTDSATAAVLRLFQAGAAVPVATTAIQLTVVLLVGSLALLLRGPAHRIAAPLCLGLGILLSPFALGSWPTKILPHGLFPLYDNRLPLAPELLGFFCIGAAVLWLTSGASTQHGASPARPTAVLLLGIAKSAAAFVVANLVSAVLLPALTGQSYDIQSRPCLILGACGALLSSLDLAGRLVAAGRAWNPESLLAIPTARTAEAATLLICVATLAFAPHNATAPWLLPLEWHSIIGTAVIAALLLRPRNPPTGIDSEPADHAYVDWPGRLIAALTLWLAGSSSTPALIILFAAAATGALLGTTHHAGIRQTLAAAGRLRLLPYLLFITGLCLDFRVLFAYQTLLFGMIFGMAMIAASLVSCGTLAMLMGFNPIGALRIGLLLAPPALPAVLLATAACASGLLPQHALAGTIIMILTASLLSTPLANWLMNQPESGSNEGTDEENATRITPPQEQPTNLPSLANGFLTAGFAIWRPLAIPDVVLLRKDPVLAALLEENRQPCCLCADADSFTITTILDSLDPAAVPPDPQPPSNLPVDGPADDPADEPEPPPLLSYRELAPPLLDLPPAATSQPRHNPPAGKKSRP